MITLPSPEITDAHLSEEVCSRRRWSGEKLCNATSEVLLVAVCVHEHLTPRRPFCASHAESHARAGRLACVPCATGPQAHFCLMRVIHEESA